MKKNHLTIIFMKDTRKPITFEVSIKLIILLVVLFVGSASTYAFFIREYYTLNQDNEKLELIIRSLKTETARLQNTIARLKDEDSSGSGTVDADEKEQPEDEIIIPGEDILSIENLNLYLNARDSKADFHFILHKNAEDDDIVRGYLFLALKDSNTGEKFSSFPNVEYKDGQPVNFRQGDRYAIRRFKEYKGILPLTGREDLMEVLVYSDLGDLLLRFRRRFQN